MNEGFISRKDSIVVSAIEIISESGLASLSTRSLAMKENMSEALLYKYFGGINEVLVEVVEYFAKFDKSIRKTIAAKEEPNLEKIHDFFENYAIYYDNYVEISAIVLNYEELLHNTGTREIIASCIMERDQFLRQLVSSAIAQGEMNSYFTVGEFTGILKGILHNLLLDRRVIYHPDGLREEIMAGVDKMITLVKLEP